MLLAIGWTVLMATGDAHNIRRWQRSWQFGRDVRMLRPGVVLLPVLAFVLQFIVPAQLASAGDMESLAFMIGHGVRRRGVAAGAAGAAGDHGCAASSAMSIYLSLMPGQQGQNAYGPDPRGDMICAGRVARRARGAAARMIR